MIQRLRQDEIAPGRPGWDAPANANTQGILRWLTGQPFTPAPCARVSGSNTEAADGVLNLANFPPGDYKYAVAILRDPEGSEKPLIWSNGTNWKYLVTGNNVTGIT